jgi:predicted site-specific integrase-resolvase
VIVEARPLVTVTEAVQMVRVSPATIYNWMKKGRVQWVTLPSGRRRIYADTLVQNRTPTQEAHGAARG